MAHCNFLNSFKLQTLQAGPNINHLCCSVKEGSNLEFSIYMFVGILWACSIPSLLRSIISCLQFTGPTICSLFGAKIFNWCPGENDGCVGGWVSCCPRLGLVLWSPVPRSGHSMPHTEPSHHQNDQPGLGQWNLTSPPPQPWPPVNPGKYLILIVNKNISL